MFLATSRFALLVLGCIAPRTFILVAGASANPACPGDTVYCDYFDRQASSDSAGSCYFAGYDITDASYDLVQGTFRVGVQQLGPHKKIIAGVDAGDEYRVVGLPPGTNLSFVAELRLRGSLSGGCFRYGYAFEGWASATLREGDSNEASFEARTRYVCDETTLTCCVEEVPLDRTLQVSIQRSVDEVFTLRFGLSCTRLRGFGLLLAQLTFSGLPPGASIVSCQGYRQDFVTAALPMSWGQLKLRYR